MRQGIKIRKSEFIYSWMMIYITSKILWDQIPLVFELISLILIGVYSVSFFYKSLKAKTNGKLILWTMAIWFYILLNALFQDTFKQLVRALYEHVFYMFCFYAAITIRPKVNLIVCLKILSVWGFVISLLTWVEYISKSYFLKDLSGSGTILNVGSYGFRSAVFSRSFLSHGVVLGIFFLVGVFIWYITHQTIWILNGIFAYVSILATGSRGPLVAFACAALVWLWADAFFVNRKRGKKDKFILSTAILGFIVIVFFSTDIKLPNSQLSYFIYRTKNIVNWKGDAGNAGRILIWTNSINNWFLKSPLIGIGPSKTGSWGAPSLGVTESGILKRLCELGVIGALGIYGFIVYIVKGLFKKCKNMDKNDKKELIFWFSIFVGIFVNDTTVQSTEEIMVAFWYWMALGMVYYIKNNREKSIAHIA